MSKELVKRKRNSGGQWIDKRDGGVNVKIEVNFGGRKMQIRKEHKYK
jgi:hypothetical protein